MVIFDPRLEEQRQRHFTPRARAGATPLGQAFVSGPRRVVVAGQVECPSSYQLNNAFRLHLACRGGGDLVQSAGRGPVDVRPGTSVAPHPLGHQAHLFTQRSRLVILIRSAPGDFPVGTVGAGPPIHRMVHSSHLPHGVVSLLRRCGNPPLCDEQTKMPGTLPATLSCSGFRERQDHRHLGRLNGITVNCLHNGRIGAQLLRGRCRERISECAPLAEGAPIVVECPRGPRPGRSRGPRTPPGGLALRRALGTRPPERCRSAQAAGVQPPARREKMLESR